jgi:hypothetical protein
LRYEAAHYISAIFPTDSPLLSFSFLSLLLFFFYFSNR